MNRLKLGLPQKPTEVPWVANRAIPDSSTGQPRKRMPRADKATFPRLEAFLDWVSRLIESKSTVLPYVFPACTSLQTHIPCGDSRNILSSYVYTVSSILTLKALEQRGTTLYEIAIEELNGILNWLFLDFSLLKNADISALSAAFCTQEEKPTYFIVIKITSNTKPMNSTRICISNQLEQALIRPLRENTDGRRLHTLFCEGRSCPWPLELVLRETSGKAASTSLFRIA